MMQNIPDNTYDQYQSLLRKIISRAAEVQKFQEFLQNKTCWLSAPASTRYHLNIKHGLLMHSVGVAQTALAIKSKLAPDITDESIVICALFHDLGKVGYPGKPYYLPNNNQQELDKRGITYKINSEIVTMNIAVRSLYIISQHLPLSDEEAQAIVAHDGIYPVSGGVNNLDYHHNECRLQMIIHFADKWTAAVVEEGRK